MWHCSVPVAFASWHCCWPRLRSSPRKPCGRQAKTWNGGIAHGRQLGDASNWVGTRAGLDPRHNNSDTATFNTAIVNTWGNAVGNPIVIDQGTQNIGNITFDTNAGSYFIGGTLGGSGPGGYSLREQRRPDPDHVGPFPANSNTAETSMPPYDA